MLIAYPVEASFELRAVDSTIVSFDFRRRSITRHETNTDPHYTTLYRILQKGEKKMDEISQSVMRTLCFIAMLFHGGDAIWYTSASWTRQGKEYRVIDGIINSAATNRDAMRDRATDMDCELTNLAPARRRSVEY